MRERSSETPPNGALTWPSSEVPVPNGDHRHARLGAELHDLGHLGFGLGEQHRVGRLALEPGERIGVLLAKRLAQREAIAEARGKLREERAFALRRGACFRLCQDRGHGVIL